jgi:alkylhydroperoxidase/carboxymuconolactone decarboxylase family protein YurZ
MKLFSKISATALLMIAVSMFSCVTAQQKSAMERTLSPKQQGLITIAAYTAKGDLSKLKTELHTGLDAGLTVNKAKEAMVHLYAYCGFPRSIRGLQTLMTVLDERKAKGIQDEWGAEATPITDERSKYERGKEILGKLTGTSQDGPKTGYAAFAPEIEVFLKEHLFADIFERDVLSYSERELVTVSVLSSIGGVEPMLHSHFNICLNIGLTPEQLRQIVGIIESTIGKKEAQAAQAVLDEVLQNNKS